ncbi:MAG: hypothetical protein KAX78_12760 [Phycisphaerae bacterium]|nr:hypothetical protein [Phycisphaerae bacterium]
MIESVLCVPLIALVLGLTFFFGWAMRNQQRVIISDRYAVWRRVVAKQTVGGGQLDAAFFGYEAGTVNVDYGGGPDGTLVDYVSAAAERGGRAEELAERLVEHFPRSHSAVVSADFPSDVPMWSGFTGAIRRRHVRDGVEWRRGEVEKLIAHAESLIKEAEE